MARTPHSEPPRLDAEGLSQQARVAALSRHHPDDPATEQAAREYRACRVEAHIRKLLAEAPPLSAERRARIAAILFAPPAGGDAA
jgi:hypothetical protein